MTAAVVLARIELELAVRVLETFNEDVSHQFARYLAQVAGIVEPFVHDASPDASRLRGLAVSLAGARESLASEIADLHGWRRLMQAVHPNETVLRVPSRFVGVVHVDAEPLRPMTASERRIWLV